MFILFDDWSASWNAILICLLEVVLVSWIYGIDKFFANIDEMGLKLEEAAKMYFRICLCYIAPCLLSILLVTSLALSQPSEANVFGKMYIFEETGVQVLAWLLGIFSISFINYSVKPHKISAHSAYSDNHYFHLFYPLSD